MSQAVPPTLQALLDQSEWVRALARRLVGDVHEAEDLAQQTMAVAIERPPRDASHPRGWLARVLQNLHQQRLRRRALDAPRHGQELDASAPAAAEVVERAEVHQLLVRHVLELDEPYKTTVLLRYFDGLGPSAIAERQGIPMATVTSRLTRAHARLRERLDRTESADGRHGIAVLLPLVTPRSGGTLITSATFVMNAKLKIAVTAFVLASLGVIGAQLGDVDRIETGPTDVDQAAVLTPLLVEVDEIAPAQVGRKAADSEESSAAAVVMPILSGRVFDADGTPVANATVVLGAAGALQFLRNNEAAPEHLVHAISGEDGRFSFVAVPSGAVLLAAGSADAAPSETLAFELGEGDTRDDIALTLRRGVRIHGEVHRRDGSLATHRTMRFLLEVGSTHHWDDRMIHSIVTDDRGRFDEPHLAPGRWGLVSFPTDEEVKELGGSMAEDMLQTTVTLEDGQEEFVVLGATSADAVTVTGQVLAGDKPAKGMMQWVGECDDPMGSQQIAQLDDEGRYEVELPVPGAWYVRVMGGGQGEYFVDIPEVAEHEQDFALPGAEMTGRVVDAEGNPIEGASVSHILLEGKAYRNPLRLADDCKTTKEDGTFHFIGLSPGTYQLGVVHAENGSITSPRIVVEDGEHVTDLEFALATGHPIAGTVHDATGLPMIAIPIWIHDADGQLVNPITRTVTNLDGRFTTPALPPGEYSLIAKKGMLVAQRVGVVIESDGVDEIELELQVGATLAVEVTAGDELVRAHVRVTDPEMRTYTGLRSKFDPWSWRRYPFDSRRKRVGPLPPGTYTLSAHVPGVGDVSREITVSPAETRDVSLTIE